MAVQTEEVEEEKNHRDIKFERDENREPKSYPRGSNAIQSVRQQATKSEKNAEKRKEKREKRKQQEKFSKEEQARKKNMKMAELVEKMEELKEREI